MLVVGILWGVCLSVFYKSLKYNKITIKIFGSWVYIPYICNTKGGDKGRSSQPPGFFEMAAGKNKSAPPAVSANNKGGGCSPAMKLRISWWIWKIRISFEIMI